MHIRKAIILLMSVVGFICIFVGPVQAVPQSQKRPKIGLVLAGGGALGFAHVGVLRVLEEEHIPVHLVTGTSMGAIVGAAYAAGRGVTEMESILSEIEWDALFEEYVPRRSVPYRLKAGREREIYGDVKLSFTEDGIALPGGVVQGQLVLPVLQKLFEIVPSPVKFDDLNLPFRAVVADIETGQAIVPSEGDLATIVRASMSVPGFFAPVPWGDKLLVDGGIANNLPIDEAFKLGADRLIVVELGADFKKRDALAASPLAITGQVISLLLAQNAAIQKKLLRPQDVMIEPNLHGYASTDFNRGSELMKLGEEAARALVPQLRSFKVSDQEWAAYQKRRKREPLVQAAIDVLEVESTDKRDAAFIKAELEMKAGDQFDRSKIEEVVKNLYETGQYREVRYDFYEKDGQNVLKVTADPKAWHKKYLQIGMAVEDDFEGESDYRLGLHYRHSDLNDAGGTLDLDGEIGRSPRIFGEFYQPFTAKSPYFIAPSVEIGKSQIRVRQDDDVVAVFDRTVGLLALRAGRELGHSGEFYVGAARGTGKLERDIGDQSLPEFDYDIGGVFGTMVIDDLDKPDFPTEGILTQVQWRSELEDIGASDDFDTISANISKPFTLGRNTLILTGTMANTFQERPVERSFALGGFFNISGYQSRSLVASDYVIGRAIFFHRFAELKVPFFGFNFFAGGSFEMAHLQSDIESIPDNPSIAAGSAFLGADTPLVPVYLGFGINDEHESSIYFALGRLDSGRTQ